MSTYLTHAIPLRLFTLPKDAVLVNLLTLKRGKVSGILRGGKKIKGKLPNYFSLISELEVMVAPGKNFDIIAGVDQRQIFFDLQTNLDKRLLALTMLDVINRVSNEYETDVKLYGFLLHWLEILNKKNIRQKRLFLALSLWILLSKIGFRPNVGSCVQCQGDLDGHQLFYQTEFSGFVCPKCARPTVRKISSFSSDKLKNIAAGEDLNIFDFLEKATETDIDLSDILLHHVETILEFEIKGSRVYNEIVI